MKFQWWFSPSKTWTITSLLCGAQLKPIDPDISAFQTFSVHACERKNYYCVTRRLQRCTLSSISIVLNIVHLRVSWRHRQHVQRTSVSSQVTASNFAKKTSQNWRPKLVFKIFRRQNLCISSAHRSPPSSLWCHQRDKQHIHVLQLGLHQRTDGNYFVDF